MPFRDYRISVFSGTKQADATFGRVYDWVFEGKIWGEVVQLNNPPTNMQSSNTFASEFKVIVQTPPDQTYPLETTRFVYTRRGRTYCLQPYRIEVVSGTRVERCMYRCKQVSMIETGGY